MTMCRKPHVLVVDDEPVNISLLEGWLRPAGYQICTATNSREALEIVPRLSPDVILLDVMMPGIDGFEVCQQLKADPQSAGIPIVMLTALTDTQDYVRGIECGADDFLSKPFEPTILLARIKSYIRSKNMQDELVELHRFRNDMMRMVVHDLNNYLGAVLGSIELVEQTCELPDKQRNRVEKALASTQEACRLLANVMDIERLDQNTIVVRKEPTRLFDLIQDVAKNMEEMLSSHGHQILLSGSENLTCAVDSMLTRRTLLNLLHNAERYGPENSVISIEWGTEDDQTLLAVSNDGSVIPAAEQNRIFDRFYQIKSTPEHARGGTGLGLAFAKLATEAQGGDIRVVSPLPGRDYGARFELRFPVGIRENERVNEPVAAVP